MEFGSIGGGEDCEHNGGGISVAILNNCDRGCISLWDRTI